MSRAIGRHLTELSGNRHRKGRVWRGLSGLLLVWRCLLLIAGLWCFGWIVFFDYCHELSYRYPHAFQYRSESSERELRDRLMTKTRLFRFE